jgi:hypothetical protein
VEAAVYFCCTEALRGADGPSSVDLSTVGDDLVLRIVGAPQGIDLQGIEDRVEAVGGVMATAADLLVLTIPMGADERPATDQPVGSGVPSTLPHTADSRSGPNAALGM